MYTAIEITKGDHGDSIIILAGGGVEDMAALSHKLVRDIWSKSARWGDACALWPLSSPDQRSVFIYRLLHQLVYSNISHRFISEDEMTDCQHLMVKFDENSDADSVAVVSFDSEDDCVEGLCELFDTPDFVFHPHGEVTVTLPADTQITFHG